MTLFKKINTKEDKLMEAWSNFLQIKKEENEIEYALLEQLKLSQHDLATDNDTLSLVLPINSLFLIDILPKINFHGLTVNYEIKIEGQDTCYIWGEM